MQIIPDTRTLDRWHALSTSWRAQARHPRLSIRIDKVDSQACNCYDGGTIGVGFGQRSTPLSGTEGVRRVSKFTEDLLESLNDVLAHARGKPSGVQFHTVKIPDVRAIRRQLHMSQQKFANTYRIPLPTLKNWE
jgi:hypothetical protein